MQQNISVIDAINLKNVKMKIIQYNQLRGAKNMQMADNIYRGERAGYKLKQVTFELNGGGIRTVAGALSYFKGNIKATNGEANVSKMFKRVLKSTITDDNSIYPKYEGFGDVVLEPSFNHFIVFELNNESIIVDKGLFYCCSDGVEISTTTVKTASSALLGGEGLFQTELKGTGFVVLATTVPETEITRIELNEDDVLKVDGNFVIARTSNIEFTVTKSATNIVTANMNGEGFMNTYKGKGVVWLCPTLSIY